MSAIEGHPKSEEYGGTGGEKPHAEVSGNILGFFGRSGDELDAIGFFLE